MPNMKITVKQKSVYGRIWLYPVDKTAEQFLTLLNKKTFIERDIDNIKKLGYKVDIIPIGN